MGAINKKKQKEIDRKKKKEKLVNVQRNRHRHTCRGLVNQNGRMDEQVRY